jgi:hypothetical protein
LASRYSLILLLLLFLIGCRPATPPPATDVAAIDQTRTASDPATASASAASPATQTSVPEDVEAIRNGAYQLAATDALQVVQLTDGKFEQGTPGAEDFISIFVTDFVALGDLNADGTEEGAALISENYGGTGVFVFLAVYANVNGTWTFQTSTLVDDRPQVRALSIANNEIFLDTVIHGTDEPTCCPTLRTTRHYRFVDNQLDLIDFTTFTPDGQPRTITIESPVDGSEVFTSVPIKGNVAIAPFENNLVYRIFDISGIELSAGAIMVNAPDLGAPGTFDVIIPLGNALSGSIIRVEVQDQSAADGSLLSMDSVELVVK